jgi:excisionase family DNA binding protein
MSDKQAYQEPKLIVRNMFRVDEVAELLKFTPRQVRNMLVDGRLKGKKFGRCLRVWAWSVAEYQASGEDAEEAG